MRWVRAVAVGAVSGALCVVAALTVGPFATVITDGTSMAPRISAGDLAVVGPAASYGVGDAVAYRSPMLDTVVLHRIVAVQGDRFVLHGDDNSWLDPERPTVDAVVGKELLHVPRGGIWLGRLISPPVLAACTFLLVAGGTAAAARTHRHRRKERRTVPARHRRTPTRRLGAMNPALQRSPPPPPPSGWCGWPWPA